MYVVIRVDFNNVPSVNSTRVYTSMYAACRELDNAHAQCQPMVDREEATIERVSDTLLRVADLSGRVIEQYEVRWIGNKIAD